MARVSVCRPDLRCQLGGAAVPTVGTVRGYSSSDATSSGGISLSGRTCPGDEAAAEQEMGLQEAGLLSETSSAPISETRVGCD